EYVEFGKKYGHDFEKSLAFEKIMSEYAISSGAIQEYEKTGILPKWYSEKEKLTYDSIFKEEKELNNAKASLVIALFEHHFVSGSGAGNSIVMAAAYAVMPPGWNDRVS